MPLEKCNFGVSNELIQLENNTLIIMMFTFFIVWACLMINKLFHFGYYIVSKVYLKLYSKFNYPDHFAAVSPPVPRLGYRDYLSQIPIQVWVGRLPR